mmetsp:Transcript_12359/g.48061  ORF Transcript_12359/g.48061 Transcript_12359/m.48061 type:complete len:224 (+) Transcript_12359:607-1278(+)
MSCIPGERVVDISEALNQKTTTTTRVSLRITSICMIHDVFARRSVRRILVVAGVHLRLRARREDPRVQPRQPHRVPRRIRVRLNRAPQRAPSDILHPAVFRPSARRDREQRVPGALRDPPVRVPSLPARSKLVHGVRERRDAAAAEHLVRLGDENLPRALARARHPRERVRTRGLHRAAPRERRHRAEHRGDPARLGHRRRPHLLPSLVEADVLAAKRGGERD